MDVQYEVLAGDPGIVKTKGEEYQAIAAAISASVRTLDDIVDQVDQKSLAMDATRDLASDVASEIRHATDRYQRTGDALVAYAIELERTQNDSRYPARRIGEVESALVGARTRRAQRQDEYDIAVLGGDADAIDTAHTRLTNARGTVTSLESSLLDHQTAWHTAQSEKSTAAQTAVSAIVAVTEGDAAEALNDDFWDKLGVVVDFVKVICDIAAILSIFLSWVPILGQVLLVLAAIGAILAIVDAAIKWGKGEGSFGEFLGAVVMGVLSLYGGKILGFLAKRVHLSAIRQIPAAAQLSKASDKLKIVSDLVPNANRGVLGFLKSPFVRSTSDMYRKLDFQTGGKFWTILKDAATQSNPFKLRNLTKYDGDVADLFRITTDFGDFINAATHNKANVLVMLEFGHMVSKNWDAATGLLSKISDGTPVDNVIDVVQEAAGRLAGPVPKVVDKGLGAYQDIAALAQNGTN